MISTPSREARGLFLGVLLVGSLASSPAWADHDLGAELAGKAMLVLYGELLIPELRLELPQASPAALSLVLTEPLHFALPMSKESPVALAVLFEPQYQIREDAWRVVLGLRADFLRRERVHNAFTEVLAVAGEDGSGAAIGLGYVLFESIFPLVSFGYRITYTLQTGLRHDVTIDLVTSKVPLGRGAR